MFRFTVARRGALAALLLSACAPVGAQGPLTLREALIRTLEGNPDLAAYRQVLRAQDGRVLQARLRPNPTVSADAENVLGSGATRGLDRAEWTLSLSQLIEPRELRDRRAAAAQAEREGLDVDAEALRLDLLAQTARRFVALVTQQETHLLSHRAVELAEKTASVVDRRVRAAKSPDAEADRAAVALERARIADAHVEHELLAARTALAACWAGLDEDFAEASADLYALPPVAPYDVLLASLERAPDVARYRAQARVHEAEQALARAGRRPGITLGAGVRRLEASDDQGLVFSLGLPLGMNDRNQGLIQEAQARRDGAEAQGLAALVRARAQLFGLHRELLDRHQQVDALRTRALPRMEAALANTEYAYERGRYGYLELVDAQRELLDVRASLIEAASQYHLTLIDIERLTGLAASR